MPNHTTKQRSPDRLDSPFGSVILACYQPPPRAPLRAWDAADEYLLRELRERGLPAEEQPLIANDSAGALAVTLRAYHPISWSDSYLAHRALAENLSLNDASADAVTILLSTDAPERPCALALIKVPKTLALLEAQLHALRPQLSAESAVIGAGMTRHVHKSTLACFERVIGPTTTSLARKKARLIYARFDPERAPPSRSEPTRYTVEMPDLPAALEFRNRANVFARKRLDIGTRLLLQHIPSCAEAGDIIDLGCGNGVLGCAVAHRAKDAAISFTDESYLAIACARDNFTRAFAQRSAPARFMVTDCLQGISHNSADLILCNPPFHQQHAVGVHVATRMFRESASVLRSGGRLAIVANRHLPYARILRDFFARVQTVAEDRRFAIVHAWRPR